MSETFEINHPNSSVKKANALTKVTIDLEAGHIKFHDNTKDSFDTFRLIFATYSHPGVEGATYPQFEMNVSESTREVTISAQAEDLVKLINICKITGVLEKVDGDNLMKYISDEREYTQAGRKSGCAIL